jgi:hypothetical protein
MSRTPRLAPPPRAAGSGPASPSPSWSRWSARSAPRWRPPSCSGPGSTSWCGTRSAPASPCEWPGSPHYCFSRRGDGGLTASLLRGGGGGRYNKTLLGDKLGKFPAPLLMNTVHFALQAGLSKLIIFLQSKGPEAAVEMGWKDYFIRGADLARSTRDCSYVLRLLVYHGRVAILTSRSVCSRANCSRDGLGHKPEQRISCVHLGDVCYYGVSTKGFNSAPLL